MSRHAETSGTKRNCQAAPGTGCPFSSCTAITGCGTNLQQEIAGASFVGHVSTSLPLFTVNMPLSLHWHVGFGCPTVLPTCLLDAGPKPGLEKLALLPIPLAARGATSGTKPMRQSRQVQMQIRSPVMHATCSPCCKDAELLPSRLMVPLDSCECAYLRTSQTNDRQEKDQTWDLIADVKRLR